MTCIKESNDLPGVDNYASLSAYDASTIYAIMLLQIYRL